MQTVLMNVKAMAYSFIMQQREDANRANCCGMEYEYRYGIWGMKYGVFGMEYEYRVWNMGCGVWRMWYGVWGMEYVVWSMGHQFHVGHLELAESGSTEYQVKETVVVCWTHLQHHLTSLRGEGRKRWEDG